MMLPEVLPFRKGMQYSRLLVLGLILVHTTYKAAILPEPDDNDQDWVDLRDYDNFVLMQSQFCVCPYRSDSAWYLVLYTLMTTHNSSMHCNTLLQFIEH